MWNNIERIDSAEGSVAKFVFKNDNAVVESVLYRYPDYETRTVICCSTMSGCPIGCRFCGAGDYFVRSLTGDEITAQVQHCIDETGVDASTIEKLQIMFMSMGEPMLNQAGMSEAIQKLHGLYPNAALLISTSAPDVDYSWINELSQRIPNVGLQFSVHESTDERRNRLIPFKKKLLLEGIAAKGAEWHKATGRSPFFNYCAGDDNSSTADADRLLALFDPAIWCATVSVICERNEGMPARNEHQMNLAREFSAKLVERGFDVRIFDPAGQDDIGGGCGQLWYVQEWMRENPSLAKATVGNGKDVVHAPRLQA